MSKLVLKIASATVFGLPLALLYTYFKYPLWLQIALCVAVGFLWSRTFDQIWDHIVNKEVENRLNAKDDEEL